MSNDELDIIRKRYAVIPTDLRYTTPAIDSLLIGYHRDINALLDQLESKWIPVEERLPKPYVSVIGRDRFYNRIGEAHLAGWGEPHLVFIDSDDCYITHWIPLPDYPDGDEEE